MRNFSEVPSCERDHLRVRASTLAAPSGAMRGAVVAAAGVAGVAYVTFVILRNRKSLDREPHDEDPPSTPGAP